MRIIIIILGFILLFNFAIYAVELDDFSISATIYPNKLPNQTSHNWLVSNQEWLSLSVDFIVNLFRGLYTRFDTETYIFATNGYRFAPSSVKFVYELGYSFDKVSIKYRHFCHHYFHQFSNNYNDSDKLVLEYSF